MAKVDPKERGHKHAEADIDRVLILRKCSNLIKISWEFVEIRNMILFTIN